MGMMRLVNILTSSTYQYQNYKNSGTISGIDNDVSNSCTGEGASVSSNKLCNDASLSKDNNVSNSSELPGKKEYLERF